MDYAIDELLDALPEVFRWSGPAKDRTKRFRGVSTDSRKIRSGDLFVALRGERFDGHEFVETALQRGAVAAVVDETWASQEQREDALPLLVADDTLRALKALANFHRRHFDLPILALTGTVGKTTAKELIAAVLARRFRVLRNESSFNNAVGVSLTLFRLEPEHELAVTEIGTNHSGEIYDLTGVVEPTAGLLLNIGRGHLEYFGSVEGVLREKLDLVRWLREHKRGPVFVNLDDPLLASNLPEGVEAVTFGQSENANVQVKLLDVQDGRAVLAFRGQRVKLAIPGAHHVTNAAAAVAVGLHFGVGEGEIAAALAEAGPAAHRGQIVQVAGVTLVDETYNCNPESARAALRLLRSLEGERRIAVLGDMLELGDVAEEEHRALGKDLESYGVDSLFAFGPLSSFTVKGARETGVRAFHFDDKDALTEALLASTKPGDVVLFKGSRGMRMEEVYERIRDALSKRET
ncbi:MAG: UDP-N-acetylmuramoyl-tripeptide--D-alanyl-D-alanine ligase [Calditrichaeota bacterium]|nr:UDP-N-acetylmuramoyl-tripeptide--D-alanyl-D-alanine ligase [Calditrichota bacterium]